VNDDDRELTINELRLLAVLINALDGMTTKLRSLHAVISRMEKAGETTTGNGAKLGKAWQNLEPHIKRLKGLLEEISQNGTRAVLAAHLLEETETKTKKKGD